MICPMTECLHGKTQNQNESFSGMIWNSVPGVVSSNVNNSQQLFVDATAHFHIGNLATLMVYDKLDIERGYYTTKGCIDDDCVRINKKVVMNIKEADFIYI